MKCEACRKGKARGFDADGVHLCAACLAVCIPDERSGAECHDCGTLTDSREADDAGRCAQCAWLSARPQLDTFGEPVTARQLRAVGVHPLPKPVPPAEREKAHGEA